MPSKMHRRSKNAFAKPVRTPLGENLWGKTCGGKPVREHLWGTTFGGKPLGENLWVTIFGGAPLGDNLWTKNIGRPVASVSLKTKRLATTHNLQFSVSCNVRREGFRRFPVSHNDGGKVAGTVGLAD